MSPAAATDGLRVRLPCRSWQRLVCVCVCALVSILTSRASFALVLAPMCGVHAETVAAPPISRAAKEVPLAPTRCNDKTDRRLEAREHAPLPAPTTQVEFVPRLPSLRYRLSPAPRVLAPIDFYVSGERPGYQRTIERPPR